MGDRRERKLSAVFYVLIKLFLLVNPHDCVVSLNVPNLRFTMRFHL